MSEEARITVEIATDISWFQRSWVWVVMAAAIPVGSLVIGYTFFAMVGPSTLSAGVFLSVLWAIIPAALWMAGMVARRGFAGIVFFLIATSLTLMSAWTVWNYLEAVGSGVSEACEIVTPPESGFGPISSGLCLGESRLSPRTREVAIWSSFALIAFGVPVGTALSAARLRRPDARLHASEAVGWAWTGLAGIVMLLVAALAAAGETDVAGLAAFAGIFLVLGLVLAGLGRRGRVRGGPA